ncbi:toll-like receptor 13 isoform X2 [Cephus cinctus]|nr:toll-like receptor 13 isoform X2 [Cephus cinctus]
MKKCQRATNATELVIAFNDNGQIIIKESTDFDYDTDCIAHCAKNLTLQSIIVYSCRSFNGNTLTVIRHNVLFDLPSIINKNRIFIDFYDVKHKVSIHNLVLKDNIIQYLNEDTFENIDGLKNLIIKKNNVRLDKSRLYTWHYLFRKLENLTGLYVEENSSQFNNLLWRYHNDTNNVSALPNLRTLSFQGTYFDELTTETFKWLESSSVKTLNMKFTNISTVKAGAFKFFEKSLRNLDLSSAAISLKDLITLMESLQSSEETSNLTILSLANLNLKEVPYDVLKPVQYSLEALSLFGNNFNDNNENQNTNVEMKSALLGTKREITPESAKTTEETEVISSVFPDMPMLYELDLRKCNITHIQKEFFYNLGNLKKLHMSFNNILILPSNIFYVLNHLTVLDISYNRHCEFDNPYRDAMTLESESFAGLNSLKYLNLTESKIKWESSIFLSNLPSTLLKLSLCRSSLMYLTENIFDNLTQLMVLDISYNTALGPYITHRQFLNLKQLQELHMAGVGLRNISMVTSLTSLKTLNIRCNNIVNLENVFHAFTKLQYLDVSWNFLTSWDEIIFTNNINLKIVFLHSNSLNVITDAMLLDMKTLHYLSLGNNQLICNCNLKKLMEYVRLENDASFETRWESYSAINNNTTSLIVVDYHQPTTYLCFDTSSSEIIVFTNTSEFCTVQDMNKFFPALGYAVYTTLFLVIAILLVSGLIYWKWWYIRYYAVTIKNATVFGYINSNRTEDRIYVYDVFVSYSDENRNWVIQELLPNIEDSTSIKICLHERDFQVGVSILENIISGMDLSRMFLLVISDSFLKSQWCQFEMYLAQHRLLEMCRDCLILVLLEEIPKNMRPKILQYLMITKTYIVWPKNGNDNCAKKIFWQRLKKALCNTNFKLKQCSTA